MSPERTCIGCRSTRHPDELLRVALIDRSLTIGAKAGGRGAWICPTEQCINSAEKRRALPRALRTEVPREAYEKLREAIISETVFSSDRSFVKR
ncbi:MAG: YlxR family protein [Actinobacteria bacterium]|nr:YlxR family protein [Actinomycetota bacterium]